MGNIGLDTKNWSENSRTNMVKLRPFMQNSVTPSLYINFGKWKTCAWSIHSRKNINTYSVTFIIIQCKAQTRKVKSCHDCIRDFDRLGFKIMQKQTWYKMSANACSDQRDFPRYLDSQHDVYGNVISYVQSLNNTMEYKWDRDILASIEPQRPHMFCFIKPTYDSHSINK